MYMCIYVSYIVETGMYDWAMYVGSSRSDKSDRHVHACTCNCIALANVPTKV